MASQNSFPVYHPSLVPSAKTAILLDWVHSAEASSPSTWSSWPRYSRQAHAEDNINSPVQWRKRRRTPLGDSSGNTMSQRDSLIGGPDRDTPAGKSQDSPRRSPRKHSPKKNAQDFTAHHSTPYESTTEAFDQAFVSPDPERTPRPRSLPDLKLRYVILKTAPTLHDIIPVTLAPFSSL